MTARLRKLIMFPLAFAFVAALWEAYKAVGPENGGLIFNSPLDTSVFRIDHDQARSRLQLTLRARSRLSLVFRLPRRLRQTVNRLFRPTSQRPGSRWRKIVRS